MTLKYNGRKLRKELAVSLKKEEVVSRDPEVVGGELVFTGTRVPVQTLVDYLEAGHSLDDFLDGFPTVGREQATAYLRMTLEVAGDFAGARPA